MQELLNNGGSKLYRYFAVFERWSDDKLDCCLHLKSFEMWSENELGFCLFNCKVVEHEMKDIKSIRANILYTITV